MRLTDAFAHGGDVETRLTENLLAPTVEGVEFFTERAILRDTSRGHELRR